MKKKKTKNKNPRVLKTPSSICIIIVHIGTQPHQIIAK